MPFADQTPEQRAAALASARAARERAAALRDAAGVPTVAQSVRAKCIDCIYDPLAEGTWQQQVRSCVAYACPLWPHRYGAVPEELARSPYLPLSPEAVVEAARAVAENCRAAQRDLGDRIRQRAQAAAAARR